MRQSHLALLLGGLLLLSSPAFARAGWAPPAVIAKEKTKAEATPEMQFLENLSDFHRKRFAHLSPEQKKAALLYFTQNQLSPDQAVERVTRDRSMVVFSE